jgi:putative colanic acid biosynthesis acetyltransferase WcaF
MEKLIDLSLFSIGNYEKKSKLMVYSWSFFNYFVLNSSLPWPGFIKSRLLKLYGAKVGKGLVIKPKVRIKYPWHLAIGNDCWIGESVWIDNLAEVILENNVCLSQGALLLTGNHDYTIKSFPYRLGNIIIKEGAWIGAKAVVCPAVCCHEYSILTVNSVATKDLAAFQIYTGNPATRIRERKFVENS